jgi:dTDP-4-amino-4,6-dideoxygalactose transaminase
MSVGISPLESSSTPSPPIPLNDLGLQHGQIAAEVAAGWARVVSEGCFVLGPDVEEFERELARFSGVVDCVAVADGTDALELALRARSIGAGDEVIVPANASNAVTVAVLRSGARAVLVDCDARHLLIDPNAVSERIGRRTRAVIAVHLFGQMAPVERLADLDPNVDVIEDLSHAAGASRYGRPAGSYGTVAAHGLNPGSSLAAYGDAGAVLTNDRSSAELVRSLRTFGRTSQVESEVTGTSSRLDTLQAIVLRAKLRRLRRWNEERRVAARRYRERLIDEVDVRAPATLPGNDHVWHRYVVRVADPDGVAARLNAAGIGAQAHRRLPSRVEADSDERRLTGQYPAAEAASRELLSLPLYPGITERQQDRVVTVLLAAVRATGGEARPGW